MDDMECWNGEAVGVEGCRQCSALVDARTQIVNGVGPTDADLLFVGEAPGANEDEAGDPFVGRSGDVLDDGLRAAGLSRSNVRITNCVRCRPPDNRDPTAAERDNCAGYLDREVVTVDPRLVVALGKVPAERLLDRTVGITTEAGTVAKTGFGGTDRPVLLSVHPAATLYDPSHQDRLEATLQTAADYVGDGGQSTLGQF
jgi:uracil-DNA glycosylase, family 4